MERAVEIDPVSQEGWREIAATSFFARDRVRLQGAAVIALNPVNSAAVALMGMILAYSGEWDRGHALVERARALNATHPGWMNFVPFYYHFARLEYETSLSFAKRVNMPAFQWTCVAAAAAAGILGRRADAEAALDDLARTNPSYVDLTRARLEWSLWIWAMRLSNGWSRVCVSPFPWPAENSRDSEHSRCS
jgi:adenylate cyclase